jgi:hypothetical protein
MKGKKMNLKDYMALDIQATEKEIREIIGDDLLIRNRKKYIPKNMCSLKLFRLGQLYGSPDWASVLRKRED